jgi:hypothetical protein
MSQSQPSFEAEFAQLLDMFSAPDSPNRISVANLRDWIVEYLDEYDIEVAQFPEVTCRPHWNLWMVDARPQDALFVVAMFRRDDMVLCCGTGDARDIARFAESEFPDDLAELIPALARRFRMPARTIRVEREIARAWLWRAW